MRGRGCSDSTERDIQATQPTAVHSDTIMNGPADFVLTNGRVYTVNEAQPWAEALAIRGNTIVYVGDDVGAAAFRAEAQPS